jgi:hypothetical protein
MSRNCVTVWAYGGYVMTTVDSLVAATPFVRAAALVPAVRAAAPFVALTLVLAPGVARAAPTSNHPTRTARVHKAEPKACLKAPVEVVGAGESITFAFSKCDGTPAPAAIDQLSILARPASVPKPTATVDVLAKTRGNDLARGIRRLDPGLLDRLELAAEHFRKPGQTPKLLLMSGYRPKSNGSYHQVGRALDVRIDGVSNEALVAFCKTLPDTGCGYYPNSLFVHIDVRDPGTGHVAWIDASRPGEAPKYVASWPPPGDATGALPKLGGGASLPLDPDASRLQEKMRRLDRHPYSL